MGQSLDLSYVCLCGVVGRSLHPERDAGYLAPRNSAAGGDALERSLRDRLFRLLLAALV